MTVVVLSRKPLSERPIHEWLHGLAEPPVLLAPGSAVAGVASAAARHYTELAVFDSFDSCAVDLAAVALCRSHHASHLVSSGERDVIRAARIRARAGLHGQSVACAMSFRDKVRMKMLAAAAGVAVPAFIPVDTPRALTQFADAHGYPVVVKPRLDGGSRGILFLRDKQEMTSALASGILPAAPDRSGHLMAEAFIDAPLYHIDGIMAGGRISHCWPSAYSSGNAEATQASLPLASTQLAATDSRTPVLTAMASAVIGALLPADAPMAFHLEAWLRNNGEPVLCEVASRPGGAGVAVGYERAFGIHLARESLRGQAGLPLMRSVPAQPAPYTGWVAFTPKAGTFIAPREPCPAEGVTLKIAMSSGTVCHGDHRAGDGAGLALVEGEDPAMVARRAEEVTGWWQTHAGWN